MKTNVRVSKEKVLDSVVAQFQRDGYDIDEVLVPEMCFCCIDSEGRMWHVEVSKTGEFTKSEM